MVDDAAISVSQHCRGVEMGSVYALSRIYQKSEPSKLMARVRIPAGASCEERT